MTAVSLVLVLLSAVAHASWNLMLKRAGDPQIFAWWLLVVASVLLAPLGAVLLWLNSVGFPGLWFVLATIGLHVLYFNLLAKAYVQGDLSLVYPVARGMGPMLVPVLAVILLGEVVEPLAIAGIAAIICGIYTISWWGNFHQVLRSPLLFLRSAGKRYAVLTGLTIAVYSIVDKEGVSHIQPLLYMYFLSIGTAVMLAPYILASKGFDAVKSEWRCTPLPITAARFTSSAPRILWPSASSPSSALRPSLAPPVPVLLRVSC
ncbi:MAG: hypothetical protein H8E48_04030 [Chloroflexi bacterium]|nr:hypothetical protein [Chloroflexota bacterium]